MDTELNTKQARARAWFAIRAEYLYMHHEGVTA